VSVANGTRHTGILLGRCDPYGAESGGPKRVLGGLYGPRSAETPGMGLPANVAQGEWICTRQAEVRVRAVCVHGHKGQPVELCSWHDEYSYTSEVVAGQFRQVRKTVRMHGHYEEIQKRQCGPCPRCLFPPPYAELYKEVQGWQAELAWWLQAGLWGDPGAQSLRQRIEDAGKMMDAAHAAGIIHNCPLTLVPVS
jgi:hypothetical protein